MTATAINLVWPTLIDRSLAEMRGGRRWWARLADALAVASLDEQARPAHSGTVAYQDSDDIRACLNGDGQAYARLVRRYQDQVAARLWRFTRDRNDLEDLVQSVFVEAYLGLGRFRGDAPLGHWLARIATRVGYRYWKQRRAPAPARLSDERWQAVLDGRAAAHEAREALDDLLWGLSPRDRLVITLLYVEGHSVAEAARLAGWSRTMLKVQAFRARRRLRALLERRQLHLRATWDKERRT